MDRNLSPSKTQIVLADSELAKGAAPGGRMPIAGAKAAPGRGDPAYTPLTDGGSAAIAAAQERHETRARPDLVARRQARGK